MAHSAAGGRDRGGVAVEEEEEVVHDRRYLVKLENAAQRTRVRNLRVMGAGTTIANTSDALSSHERQLRAILTELKSMFEVIVIDCPPVTLVHDAALLARVADGVLFVANSVNCDKDMVLNCKSLLETAGANVVGAVLNHIDPVGIYKSNKYYHPGK
jgi:Mrp family chromosome partitioning ATPase